MAAPAVLSEKEIKERLRALPHWKQAGPDLVRRVAFPTYLDGLEFVYQLGKVADDNDHHPDVLLGYKKVEIRFGTHSAGGITDLDFKMAQKADEILTEYTVETGSQA